mgnify:CR=1 FL=1
MKKLHLLVALVAGTMAFYSCQKLIDLVPKKDGDCEKGNTEQCERKGTIVKEFFGNTASPTGNFLILDHKLNEHYFPNTKSGQEALKKAYYEAKKHTVTYGFSKDIECIRPMVMVWTTPQANRCVVLSCLNGKEVKPDGCEGRDSITMNHKGKVEIARCGVLIHTQDKSGNPIVLEPVETHNNFNYQDKQTVMFNYSELDIFAPTPCMQRAQTPITPVRINTIIEVK